MGREDWEKKVITSKEGWNAEIPERIQILEKRIGSSGKDYGKFVRWEGGKKKAARIGRRERVKGAMKHELDNRGVGGNHILLGAQRRADQDMAD